jgi:hypothetical protein
MKLRNKIYVVTVSILFLILIYIVYFQNKVSITPYIEINISKDLSSQNMQSLLLMTFMPDKFFITMQWNFNYLEVETYPIMSKKDSLFNYLGLSNYPIKGDSVYFAFRIKNLNKEKDFTYCVKSYLIDDVGYIVGSGSENYYSYENYYSLKIPKESEKTIYNKINSIPGMNNGKYRLLLLFYEIKETYSECNVQSVENDAKFYFANSFELNKPFSNFEKSIRLIIYGVFFFLFTLIYIELPLYAGKVTKLTESKEIKTFIEYIKTREDLQVSLIMIFLFIFMAFLLFFNL